MYVMTKQIDRKWVLLFIAAPGLFFVFYFFMVWGQAEPPAQRIILPEEYHLSGDIVEIGDYEIQAGLKEQTILTSEIYIGRNNRARAETGRIFLIIPLYSQNYILDLNDFIVYDSEGLKYIPLDIEQDFLANAIDLKHNIKSRTPVYYLAYKVRNNVEGYYLIMNEDDSEVAWYFARNN